MSTVFVQNFGISRRLKQCRRPERLPKDQKTHSERYLTTLMQCKKYRLNFHRRTIIWKSESNEKDWRKEGVSSNTSPFELNRHKYHNHGNYQPCFNSAEPSTPPLHIPAAAPSSKSAIALPKRGLSCKHLACKTRV